MQAESSNADTQAVIEAEAPPVALAPAAAAPQPHGMRPERFDELVRTLGEGQAARYRRNGMVVKGVCSVVVGAVVASIAHNKNNKVYQSLGIGAIAGAVTAGLMQLLPNAQAQEIIDNNADNLSELRKAGDLQTVGLLRRAMRAERRADALFGGLCGVAIGSALGYLGHSKDTSSRSVVLDMGVQSVIFGSLWSSRPKSVSEQLADRMLVELGDRGPDQGRGR